MNKQAALFDIKVNPKDVVYTPRIISKSIIQYLSPAGKCLDPCKGDGAFFDYLPEGSEYCEIHEGSDFFDYQHYCDWIIGNPPYSIFETFLQHAFSISENVAFLVPTNKVFQRQIIMNRISEYGGIKSVLVYGSGQLLDFPFGFSVGLFHFKKNYSGEAEIALGMKAIQSIEKKLIKISE